MSLRNSGVAAHGWFLMALLACFSCRKKVEFLPEGAKQVTRSDTAEANERGTVALREYRFVLSDSGTNAHTFVCESRSFPDVESARKSAAMSIAERPQAAEQKTHARFAASGRSVWLWRERELVWCMLTTPRVADVGSVMQPVVAKFKKQYQEAL